MLEKGDTIIVGSDGRDDIFLGVDQDGTPLINEDECQFLRRVEESGGDLELLVQGLESYGELTDDLSIVKLTYLKDPVRLESVANLASFPFPDEIYLKCLQDENWENTIYHLENLKSKMSEEFLPPVFKKELAKVYYKVGKYEEALFLFEELISEFPEDIEVIFNASLIYKKLKRYYESIELGERVLLREPDFLNNIVNLAESYILIYERKMALVLLEKIESLDSEHLYSQKIRIQLEQLELYKNP